LEESPQALRDMMDRKVVGKAMVVVEEPFDKLRDQTMPDESVKYQEPSFKMIEEDTSVGKVRVFGSVEDLKKQVGKSLGTSSWTTVSQEVIQKFAEATEDFQWIHIDTEKAAALLPGGKNLAHGYLTLSLVPKLIYEILPLEGVQMALNYGVNKVRFPAPVYSGDKIRLSAKLSNLEENPDGSAKLFIEATIVSNNSEKPVCVAELITLLRF
jgi:acyl dehydratase